MAETNVTNQRFGRLVALNRVENVGRHTRWLFQCDCGNLFAAYLEAVKAGRTKSCGCLRAEENRKRSFKHGHKAGGQTSPTFKAYVEMKQRCSNPNDRSYPTFGGIGISVDNRWAESFETFLADMGERPAETVLRRINLAKPFSPENCRWVRKN